MLHDEVDGHCETETSSVRDSGGRQGRTCRAVRTVCGHGQARRKQRQKDFQESGPDSRASHLTFSRASSKIF